MNLRPGMILKRLLLPLYSPIPFASSQFHAHVSKLWCDECGVENTKNEVENVEISIVRWKSSINHWLKLSHKWILRFPKTIPSASPSPSECSMWFKIKCCSKSAHKLAILAIRFNSLLSHSGQIISTQIGSKEHPPPFSPINSANHPRGCANIPIRESSDLSILSINRDSFNHKKIAWK